MASQAASGSDVAMSEADTVDEQKWMSFSVRHGKTFHNVRLAEDDSVLELKMIIFSLTDVPPERQKLLGLTRGKLPIDEAPLSSLAIPPGSLKAKHPVNVDGTSSPASSGTHTSGKTISIMLVGTPVQDTFQDRAVLLDAHGGQNGDGRKKKRSKTEDERKADRGKPDYVAMSDPSNLSKVRKTVERFREFAPIHPPRTGLSGGLLVLDLDWTIADTHKLMDPQCPVALAARPGLHEFLAAVYPYYDIAVWSQTSWRFLEMKLTELGCFEDSRYQITFILDRSSMPAVHVREATKKEVKPLDVIWNRFPEVYGAHNTVHVDDLGRNFIMNPLNGIVIRPYYSDAPLDDELASLARYCLQLANPSVTDVRNRGWSTAGHDRWHDCTLPLVSSLPVALDKADTTGSYAYVFRRRHAHWLAYAAKHPSSTRHGATQARAVPQEGPSSGTSATTNEGEGSVSGNGAPMQEDGAKKDKAPPKQS
ncbi:TFIIF-interacting CTD phosphatase, including NLI-interacting factor (involved in RNA polymerase II regulation) [Ceraceosorus bombacis]|uniref:TFIIF-interacting CTD phosphatase, including NLI-interacting factor (Involved in RNA polymerase II regulation) n=1 Tax=Ceraceosorus bombacis TaxID=401625 RepID=A0A0P1BML0_9BASI|nr:TFIIF-interacting CTD phosphatase, including NLI-interacting factor (involved in RNA polymerase II regulation) [Ceraceosorus bombacis]